MLLPLRHVPQQKEHRAADGAGHGHAGRRDPHGPPPHLDPTGYPRGVRMHERRLDLAQRGRAPHLGGPRGLGLRRQSRGAFLRCPRLLGFRRSSLRCALVSRPASVLLDVTLLSPCVADGCNWTLERRSGGEG